MAIAGCASRTERSYPLRIAQGLGAVAGGFQVKARVLNSGTESGFIWLDIQCICGEVSHWRGLNTFTCKHCQREYQVNLFNKKRETLEQRFSTAFKRAVMARLD
jgi:hypothetical protein